MKKIISKKFLVLCAAATVACMLPLAASAVDKLVVKDTSANAKFNVSLDDTTQEVRVGIGVATPAIALHVRSSDVAVYSDVLGFNQVAGTGVDISTSSGAPPAGPVQAVNNEFIVKYQSGVPITNNFNTFRMIAQIDSTVTDDITGNVNAANFIGRHNGTGNINRLSGFITNIANRGGGSVTDGNGIIIGTPTVISPSTITNAKGLYIFPQARTGVTTAYGIYQAGASDINYFQGSVGIGIVSPASKLAVSGLPTAPPDASGNQGVVCITNNGNMWIDADGNNDCI